MCRVSDLDSNVYAKTCLASPPDLRFRNNIDLRSLRSQLIKETFRRAFLQHVITFPSTISHVGDEMSTLIYQSATNLCDFDEDFDDDFDDDFDIITLMSKSSTLLKKGLNYTVQKLTLS